MLKYLQKCTLSQTNTSVAYDTKATVKNGLAIISAYESVGVRHEKLILKVPSTWEGLAACQELADLGIRTLGTIVYTKVQAALGAQSGCVAISPYINTTRVKVNPSLYTRPDNISVLQESLWPGKLSSIIENMDSQHRIFLLLC